MMSAGVQEIILRLYLRRRMRLLFLSIYRQQNGMSSLRREVAAN